MKPKTWDRHFLQSTRGRIVSLLRRANRTVNELASTLSLTDNAIRAHLTALERDGLVHRSGTRHQGHKPHHTFSLTPEAEDLFPKVYGPLLHQLLDVLAEQLAPEVIEEIVRATGHRMAGKYRHRGGGQLRDRIQRALAMLGELGGLAELEEKDGQLFIRCFGCPLSLAVAGHPEVCRLVETMLTDAAGVPFQERCQREEAPQCYFEIEAVRA